MTRVIWSLLAIWVTILIGLGVAGAQRTSGKEHRKVHRVVIEVTAEAAPQWESVLNNVENLQKAFASESTEIEVVTHGKGLAMLQKSNAGQSERIQDRLCWREVRSVREHDATQERAEV